MTFLLDSRKMSCKILQKNESFLQKSQDLVRIALFLQVFFFKILMCLTRFLQELLKLSILFMAQNASDSFPSFPLQKCSKNLAIDSEPSVSRRFRKRQEWSYPEGQDKVTLEKDCFILYFYSDKLSHYKTYDFRKCLLSDAFNMFDYKIRSTGVKFIKFYFQWLIMLAVWWNAEIIRT